MTSMHTVFLPRLDGNPRAPEQDEPSQTVAQPTGWGERPLARVREDISDPIPPDAEGKRHGEHRRRSRLVYREEYDAHARERERYGDRGFDFLSMHIWRMQLLIMERYLGIFPGDYE